MPLGPSFTGNAASDLGLGQQLADQVKSETDEERKKRMRLQQMSPGAAQLFGSAMGGGMTGGRY